MSFYCLMHQSFDYISSVEYLLKIVDGVIVLHREGNTMLFEASPKCIDTISKLFTEFNVMDITNRDTAKVRFLLLISNKKHSDVFELAKRWIKNIPEIDSVYEGGRFMVIDLPREEAESFITLMSSYLVTMSV